MSQISPMGLVRLLKAKTYYFTHRRDWNKDTGLWINDLFIHIRLNNFRKDKFLSVIFYCFSSIFLPEISRGLTLNRIESLFDIALLRNSRYLYGLPLSKLPPLLHILTFQCPGFRKRKSSEMSLFWLLHFHSRLQKKRGRSCFGAIFLRSTKKMGEMKSLFQIRRETAATMLRIYFSAMI